MFNMFGYGSSGGRRSQTRGRNSSVRGAMYMHAPEYHGPSRKDSVTSMSSTDSGEESQTLVDLNKISQAEFQKLYNSMRKGEPNNRVNF